MNRQTEKRWMDGWIDIQVCGIDEWIGGWVKRWSGERMNG